MKTRMISARLSFLQYVWRIFAVLLLLAGVFFTALLLVMLVYYVVVRFPLPGSDKETITANATALYAALTLIMAVAAALAALFTSQAANASSQAAAETHHTVQAELWYDLSSNYSSKEMQGDLKYIHDWYTTTAPTLGLLRDHLLFMSAPIPKGIDKAKKLARKAQLYDELHSARRHVSHYFQGIYTLWQVLHLLDDKTANALIDKQRIEIYRNAIEPLEWALGGGQYNTDSFDFFGKLFDIPVRDIPNLPGWPYKKVP